MIFDNAKKFKQESLEMVMCSGKYQNSFFEHFDSFSDAKRNVKALAALPIINLCLALHVTLDALALTTCGAANIAIGAATFDLNELKCGGDNLKDGAKCLVIALYCAVSIITDTLETLVRLVTHSLTSVAITREAKLECDTPSSAASV